MFVYEIRRAIGPERVRSPKFPSFLIIDARARAPWGPGGRPSASRRASSVTVGHPKSRPMNFLGPRQNFSDR